MVDHSISSPNPTTPASRLTDPLAFASELSGQLATAGLEPQPGFDAAVERHSQRCAQIGTLLADHPEARTILTEIEQAVVTVGMEQFEAGIAFGAAAECLRRTLCPTPEGR